jgi:hypothetical protein
MVAHRLLVIVEIEEGLSDSFEMGAENKMILAYWLVPAEPARSHFASLIADLAARFDAPIFEPHLTVYATRKENEDADDVLHRVIAHYQPVPLSVRGFDCSDEFTKTVFVQFEPNEQLSQLSAALRRASVIQDEYQLNPHLSLIYKIMSPETKKEIVSSLNLPFHEVLFDSAKAVSCPARIKSREDVESWRVGATQKLTK